MVFFSLGLSQHKDPDERYNRCCCDNEPQPQFFVLSLHLAPLSKREYLNLLPVIDNYKYPGVHRGIGKKMAEIIEQYKIPEFNMEWLSGKIAKLNKQAKKLGVDLITMKIVGEEFRPMFDDPRVHYKVFTVEVTGSTPKLSGWEFIATIQHVTDEEGDRAIIRAVPGKTVPKLFRFAKREWCDHCQTRRYRTDTFVVFSEGVYKVVGRQCLKDFIGHPNPERYARFATSLGMWDELMRAADHEPAEGVRFERYYPLKLYLGYVAESISRYGWVSRSRAKASTEIATADVAFRRMTKYRPQDLRDTRTDDKWAPSKKSMEVAEAALEWVRTVLAQNPDKTEYEHNLVAVTAGKAIGYREFGIAASLIYVYQREMGKQAQVQSLDGHGVHLGTVGVRQEFVVRITEVKDIEYGRDRDIPGTGSPGALVIMESVDEDASLKWFTGPRAGGMSPGKTYRIRGTPKRHSEYRGRRETILARVAMVEELDEKEAD
jgi:hypothetical protein